MARKVSVYKFRELDEVQYFLDGAIFGGQVEKGVPNLVGKTLIFTAPAAVTVTFIAATPTNDRDPLILLFNDIKAQIEAAVAGLKVKQVGGRLILVETTPTGGVALAAGGTGKGLLGFDPTLAESGRVIGPQGAAAPSLFNSYSTWDNMHILYIAEV